MAQLGQFVLVNLEGPGSFVFDFFPAEIQTSRRAAWEPQEVTIGTKPLFYGNRDPKRIVVNEVWLDRTALNESIEPEIRALFALQDEIPKLGRPPALQAIWGDRSERCILEEVVINEQWFSPKGEPQRATVTLHLLELQPERESVDVVVRDVEAESFNPLGNF